MKNRHGDAPELVRKINAALEELKWVRVPEKTWVDSVVEAWDHREGADGQEAD